MKPHVKAIEALRARIQGQQQRIAELEAQRCEDRDGLKLIVEQQKCIAELEAENAHLKRIMSERMGLTLEQIQAALDALERVRGEIAEEEP